MVFIPYIEQGDKIGRRVREYFLCEICFLRFFSRPFPWVLNAQSRSNYNKRFKTFISHCGIYNLESMYGATEETFFVNHDMGGPYWDLDNPVAQRSYATSPHKYVQNWDTPIMIITGAHDYRVPYTESLQAFNSARLRGIPARLLFFPEETHFPGGRRQVYG